MMHFTCDVSDQLPRPSAAWQMKGKFLKYKIVTSVIFAPFLLSKATNFVWHLAACNVAYFSVFRVSPPYRMRSFSSDRIDLVQQICLDLDRSDCLI